MKTLLNFLFILVLPLCAWTQAAPGGVSTGLLTWLRADAGVTVNPLTGRISSWGDQSGNGVNAIQNSSAGQPALATDAINGHPAIQLNGGTHFLRVNLSGLSGKPVTIVAVTRRQSSASDQHFIGGTNTATLPAIRIGYATNNTLRANQSVVAVQRVVPLYNAAQEPGLMLTYTASPLVGRRITEYRNNQKLSTLSTAVTLYNQNPTGFIGRGWGGAGMTGLFAEMIVYDRVLTDAEMRQVATYLNLKYGLTVPAADHTLHTMSGFNTDIFGIGRNDNWGINQVSAFSASPLEVLKATAETPMANLSYRFFGHNNLPAVAQTIGSGCNEYQLLQRKWKSTVTGSAGTVALRFNLTGTNLDTDGCVLVVDANHNGFADDPSIYGTVSGGFITFTGVNLPHGAAFTLASRKEGLFSVATGNMTDAVWAFTPTGNPIPYDPTCGSRHLTIQSGTHITLNGPFQARSVTVQAGGTLSLGTESLDLSGDLIVEGTLNPGTSVVFFSGETPQSIFSIAPITLYRALVSNPTSVSVDGAGLMMRDILRIDDGTFYTGDELTLISTSSFQGSIGPLYSGTIEGKVTVRRRHQAVVSGWMNLCSPASGMTVADWNDDIVTTGFPGANHPTYSMNSIMWYNETLGGGINNGFIGVTGVDQSVSDLRGYFVYAYSGTYNVDVTGNIFKGDVSIPVTYTYTGDFAADGWNLVANPYPSAINWDADGWNRQNIDNAVYVWDAVGGKYASYVDGIGNNGGSPIIPSSQSFFVMSNAPAPVLQLTEGAKSLNQGTFRSATERKDKLVLTLTGTDITDETTLAWDPSASIRFDGSMDAHKLPHPFMLTTQLSTLDSDGVKYSIQTRNELEEDVIPLAIEAAENGVFTLSWGELSGWLGGKPVRLVNTRSGASYNMATLRQVQFSLTSGEVNTEWQIRIGSTESDVTASEIPVTGRVTAEGLNLFFTEIDGSRLEVRVWNLIGQSLVQPVRSTMSSDRMSISLNGYAGPCLVEIVSTDTGKRTVLKLAPQ